MAAAREDLGDDLYARPTDPATRLRDPPRAGISAGGERFRQSMIDIEAAFHKLAASAFRRKFRLQGRELAYLRTWGLPHVLKHGRELLAKRLALAEPANDGRQTPWRNHPIFVAQHATATCCRGCLEKTHGLAKGVALSEDEMRYVMRVLERWLVQFLA
jgi:hypothetical protein